MSFQKKFPKESRKSPEQKRQSESPFLDEELFAGMEVETAGVWASHLVGYRFESPFQLAFEPEQEAFLEPEVEVIEAEYYAEALDEYEEDDELYNEEFDQALEEETITAIFAGEAEELEDENFLYAANDQEFIYEVEDETLVELLANELDIPETEEYYEIIAESDDDEAVAELEDEVLEQLNKLTEDQTAGEEQSPPPIQPAKEPLAIPVSDPIPFAPPPPMGSYWPVRSTHQKGREVAFRATDGTTVGNRSRAFMAKRTSKKKGKAIKRYHVGVDIYAKHGDPVVACEDGVIINFHRFLGKTKALIVEYAHVVINYGEVDNNSLKQTGLKVGSSVRAGQIIGYIGLLPKGSSMLHFETYRKGTSSNKRWYRHKKPSTEILNPTKYLLFLQQYGLVGKNTTSQPLPSTPGSGRSIDVQRAVRLNRRYGQKLGWHNYYESIGRFLGFTNISPSEESLAEAVAEWQKSQGLKPDGIIGPQTWRRMEPALGIAGKTSRTAALPAATPLTPEAAKVSLRGGKWGGWIGRQTKATTFISTSNIANKYDLAVAVAAKVETGGAFDKVQMYDKGILSWGIKQWTLHRGSLQGVLGFIKRRLDKSGQSSIWTRLFPGIDIQGNRIIINNTAYSVPKRGDDEADLALRRIFRGKESPKDFDESMDYWLKVFARAGRHPKIQNLQFEYAVMSLRKNLDKHLGKVLKARREIKESEVHNYQRVGDYIETSLIAVTLFNGMETQNPKWTYSYLKRIADRFAQKHRTYNTSQWPSGWQKKFAQELKEEFEESGVACWGRRALDKKPHCKGRTSRTQKILNAYEKLSR